VREAPSAARLRLRLAAPLERSDYREPDLFAFRRRRFPRQIIGERDYLRSWHMRG